MASCDFRIVCRRQRQAAVVPAEERPAFLPAISAHQPDETRHLRRPQSRCQVFSANQWGFYRQSQRQIVDEERIIPKTLTDKGSQEFISRAKAGKLTKITVGQTVDYYREFNRGGRSDIEAQQENGRYLIVSIDGQLLATDGDTTEKPSRRSGTTNARKSIPMW